MVHEVSVNIKGSTYKVVPQLLPSTGLNYGITLNIPQKRVPIITYSIELNSIPMIVSPIGIQQSDHEKLRV